MRWVLLVSAGLLLACWLVSAAVCSLYLGPSASTFVFGLRFAPALALDPARDLLQPERSFSALDHPQAVSLLRARFDQAIAPSDGRRLHDLVLAGGYKRGLDVGTAEGYSALWLGLAMKRTGGRLFTIEIDPKIAAVARENFRRAGLAEVIDLRVNDALREIPALPGQFDFVLLDTGAPLNTQLLGLLRARISPGGVIAAHNVIGFRSGQPGYLAAIENDPGLDTRLIPTASGGISLSFRRTH